MPLATVSVLRDLLQRRPLAAWADRLTQWVDGVVLLETPGAKIAAAVALVCMIALALLLRRMLQPRSAGRLTCGACEGVLTGRRQLTCPHCGEVLREVGRFVEGRRLAPGTRAFILLWLLCVPLPALLLMRGLLFLAPQRRLPVYVCELTPVTTTGLGRITLHLADKRPLRRGGAPVFQTMVVVFRPPDRAHRGETLPPVYVTVRYKAARSAAGFEPVVDGQARPADATMLLTHLKLLKLDVFQSQAVQQVEELIAIVHAAPAAGVASLTLGEFRLTAQSHGELVEPAPWFIAMTFTLGAGLWLAVPVIYGFGRRSDEEVEEAAEKESRR